MFASLVHSRTRLSLALASLSSALLRSRLCSPRASRSASSLLVPRLSSLPGSTPLITSKLKRHKPHKSLLVWTPYNVVSLSHNTNTLSLCALCTVTSFTDMLLFSLSARASRLTPPVPVAFALVVRIKALLTLFGLRGSAFFHSVCSLSLQATIRWHWRYE